MINAARCTACHVLMIFLVCGMASTLASPLKDSEAAILSRINPPRIPKVDFVVKGGENDAHSSINSAITTAHDAGGGRVVLPAGKWQSNGPINLKSDVELHLSAGAMLRFSTNPDHYPIVITKFEGTLLYNYSPFIRGYQLTNVALTGDSGSKIDGQGTKGFSTWRNKQSADQTALRGMGNDTVAHYKRVFGPGHYLRPVFVQFLGCKNVLIKGITLVDSPFWIVHPVFSTNVIVKDVTVDSPYVNNDGIDPDGNSS